MTHIGIMASGAGSILGTGVVLAVVVGAVVLVIRSMIKDKRNGKSIQCGGNCKNCGGHCL